ncbi:hypothetical protein RQP46_010887 [Phenoliferia psychrophenolica]
MAGLQLEPTLSSLTLQSDDSDMAHDELEPEPTTSTTPSLPPELVADIIELTVELLIEEERHLETHATLSNRFLLSAALVNRTWHSIATPVLLKNGIVTSESVPRFIAQIHAQGMEDTLESLRFGEASVGIAEEDTDWEVTAFDFLVGTLSELKKVVLVKRDRQLEIQRDKSGRSIQRLQLSNFNIYEDGFGRKFAFSPPKYIFIENVQNLEFKVYHASGSGLKYLFSIMRLANESPDRVRRYSVGVRTSTDTSSTSPLHILPDPSGIRESDDTASFTYADSSEGILLELIHALPVLEKLKVPACWRSDAVEDACEAKGKWYHASSVAELRSGSAIPRSYNLTLAPGWGAPDGFSRLLYLVNGMSPGPLIEATQGEILNVTVFNQLPSEVTIHWHGLHQRGTPEYDGVPGLSQWPILPGGNFTYLISTASNYGGYWYHAHLRNYYQDGLRGPIFIHAAPDVARPFGEISSSSTDIAAMHAADAAPQTLMLMDWFHETGDAIRAKLVATKDAMGPLCASSVLFNGVGRVQCPPADVVAEMGRDSRGCMSMSGMSGMASSTMSMPMGNQSDTAPMDSRDVCESTDSPLYTFGPPANSSWFSLQLVNSAAAQQFVFSIDSHELWVYSADGLFVTPQKVQTIEMGIGQRYGVMVKRGSHSGKHVVRASTRTEQLYQGTAILDYDMSMMDSAAMPAMGNMTSQAPDSSTPSPAMEGKALAQPWISLDGNPLNGSIPLDSSTLFPYTPGKPPNATQTSHFKVNQTAALDWELDGVTFSSEGTGFVPLLFDPRPLPGVIDLTTGAVIDIVLQVAEGTLDTMPHPIHLHGHYFWVLGSMPKSTFPTNMTIEQAHATGVSLNIDNPPYRDTAHLPVNGWLAIRFKADNFGAWLMHCHINSHLMSGMAVAFVELQNEFPTYPPALSSPPH